MNGFSTGEEDSRGPTDQICCLIDNGEHCSKPAGNASYSKRIQKTVTQRRLNLNIDNSVSSFFLFAKMCYNSICKKSLLTYIVLYISIYLVLKLYVHITVNRTLINVL